MPIPHWLGSSKHVSIGGPSLQKCPSSSEQPRYDGYHPRYRHPACEMGLLVQLSCHPFAQHMLVDGGSR